MALNDFKSIQSVLNYYKKYDNEMVIIDPFWHSRLTLHHHSKNIASVAVTVSVISLDDKGCQNYRQVSSETVYKIRASLVWDSLLWRHRLEENLRSIFRQKRVCY